MLANILCSSLHLPIQTIRSRKERSLQGLEMKRFFLNAQAPKSVFTSVARGQEPGASISKNICQVSNQLHSDRLNVKQIVFYFLGTGPMTGRKEGMLLSHLGIGYQQHNCWRVRCYKGRECSASSAISLHP